MRRDPNAALAASGDRMNEPPSILIVIADDHAIVRVGLRALLEQNGFTVVREASDGAEAVQLAEAHRPDVAVLDFQMPKMNGIEAARAISIASPLTKAVLLTVHSEVYCVIAALKAGVRGYVVKTQAAEDLASAINAVHSGSTYLSPVLSNVMVQVCLGENPQEELLTPREQEVLTLVADGKSTGEVARALDISVKTAETHRAKIMKKMHVHETASLIRHAIRAGMVEP
jgi:two-component system response regulator NreC